MDPMEPLVQCSLIGRPPSDRERYLTGGADPSVSWKLKQPSPIADGGEPITVV